MIARRLIEELQERGDHALRRILEGIQDYVVVLDRQGCFLYVNHCISEENWQRVRGQSVFNDRWICKATQTKLRAALEGAFERQESAEIEMLGVDPATGALTRWFHSRLSPLVQDGKTYAAVYISHDITERKAAAADKERMEAQLRATQKLESLGVLAGGIAHDFNNILVAILGYSDLANMDLPEGSPVREMIGHIQSGAQRAAELCRQMLAYSGKGKFLVEPLDLNAVVKEMSGLLGVSISKKARLSVELSGEAPHVRADAAQLNQIILNLITNASEALGGDNGTITLRTGSQRCDAAYLAEHWVQDELPEGDYAWFEVADTGCGMDAETASRIFDPFFTTKFTGRGLGMAAVLGIVRGHRGAIRVTSAPGEGSVFRVLLPACEAPAAAAPARAAAPAELEKTAVLIVDDEPTVIEFLTAVLSRMGFVPLAASSGREGLDLFAERGDEIGLVILDMNMPGMSGEETFKELRRARANARVILSSGYNEQEAAERFHSAGLADFLQKPYTIDQLEKSVRRALHAPFADAA